MDSFSEFSSENYAFHDSDNSDLDPHYVLEEESGNKRIKQYFNISLNNVGSVTEQHSLNDANKEGKSYQF